MARRKRRFSGTSEQHRERGKSNLREIKRLIGRFNAYMKAPADCMGAFGIFQALSKTQGAYWIDRYEMGRGRSSTGLGRRLAGLALRFEKTCVVKPRSAAAARKMRAVWR